MATALPIRGFYAVLDRDDEGVARALCRHACVLQVRLKPRDPERSPFHMHRRHLHAIVHRVQDAIVTRPERDWDMAALAAYNISG